jgi:hypothetical protein
MDFENAEPNEKTGTIFLRSKIIAYKRVAHGKPEWCPGSETAGAVRSAVSAAIRRVGHNATATELAAELRRAAA